MEFTTPPSYDSVRVSVGCIATDGKIFIANANSSATHTRTEKDAHSNLDEPKEVTYAWNGKSADGKVVTAEITGSVGERLDRIDIMAEIPKFLKGIVAGAIGAQPFIYQVCICGVRQPRHLLTFPYSTVLTPSLRSSLINRALLRRVLCSQKLLIFHSCRHHSSLRVRLGTISTDAVQSFVRSAIQCVMSHCCHG